MLLSMLTLVIVDGSNIKNVSSPAQLGDACSLSKFITITRQCTRYSLI